MLSLLSYKSAFDIDITWERIRDYSMYNTKTELPEIFDITCIIYSYEKKSRAEQKIYIYNKKTTTTTRKCNFYPNNSTWTEQRKKKIISFIVICSK